MVSTTPDTENGAAGAEERVVPADKTPGGLTGVIMSLLETVGETANLAWATLLSILRGGFSVQDLIQQMSAIGADSMLVVLIVTTSTGAVFALYASKQAVQYGFGQFVGGGIAYTFFNELGPVLGGVALAARSGAAIAAEIGSMVVTEQVDALRAMAISPVRYLVTPRVLAALIMMPVLTIISDFAGLLGGMSTSTMAGVPAGTYWESVRAFNRVIDVEHGLMKAAVFGFLIGISACMQGLSTNGGATGVGKATTRSVVMCVVLIFLGDVVMARLLTGPVGGR
jgi:phospholipid/cholesterol/gamma-HCH transport system permease protein